MDPRIAHLPVERISRRTFDRLLEYSCSEPTGVVMGKVWKRNIDAYPNRVEHQQPSPAPPPCWVICEYVSAGIGFYHVDHRRPEIIEDPNTTTN